MASDMTLLHSDRNLVKPIRTRTTHSDRFDLILQLVDVRANMAKFELAAAGHMDEQYEQLWPELNRVREIGRQWVCCALIDSVPELPALVDGLSHYQDELGRSICDLFIEGFSEANAAACIYPMRRQRDERPEIVLAENSHFWVAPAHVGLVVVSKNVAGGFGSVALTPLVAKGAFRVVARNQPFKSTYWYNADPYGTNEPTQTLLRDDLVAGWLDEEDDAFGTSIPHRNSETLGELYLKIEDPGDGELYFGAPAQEEEQLHAFLALRGDINRLFEEAYSPERRAAAEARAKIINSRATRSFLCPSGYCNWCRADVTPLLLDRPAGAHITGCPACMRTWCD